MTALAAVRALCRYCSWLQYIPSAQLEWDEALVLQHEGLLRTLLPHAVNVNYCIRTRASSDGDVQNSCRSDAQLEFGCCKRPGAITGSPR